MAILDIKIFPDKILKTPTEPVEAYDNELTKLIEDMKETMYAARGIGLAANQVGRPLSLFIMDINAGDKNAVQSPKVFINPTIIYHDNERSIQEGCLSIPGAFMWNTRYETCEVHFYDEKWKENQYFFTGKEAVCIQHEMDHLDGKLFIDNFGPVKRLLAVKRHKKFMKAKKRGQIKML